MNNDMLNSIESINEDSRLIQSVKNGNNDAIKLLINKHSGVCVNVYKKYINLPNICGFISDEIISSKDYIIYNSAKTYNPDMGSKFSTWLSNQTRYFCLNCINKNNKLVPTESEDLVNLIDFKSKDSENSTNQKDAKAETLEIIKETLDELTNEKIKETILRKYFSTDSEFKTYTDIAQEMNVTVQTIINWHKKFINLIRQKCINRKIIFDFK
jgi:RNA polymerase sigma factor (sigma-70 family)